MTQNADTQVGFVGAGNMGRHMIACFLKSGRGVYVVDQRPVVERDEVLSGATQVASLAELAVRAPVVLTSLPGPPEVTEVYEAPGGLLESMAPGSGLIDLTTTTPSQSRQIAAQAKERGIAYLDAPVAGGVRGARNGTLTLMVGGSQADFAAQEQVLRVIGTQVIHVGPAGSGHAAKLANNMMTIGNALVAMEAMLLAVKSGVAPERMLDVAAAGTGDSFALNLFRYVILDRKFTPAKFSLALAEKDLRVAVEYAHEISTPVDLVAYAATQLQYGVEAGLADKDWSSYITLLEGQTDAVVARSAPGGVPAQAPSRDEAS